MVELICHPGVKRIEWEAFCECRSLKRIVIPGVRFIESYAFQGCNHFTDIECGMLERIGSYAFHNCKSLTSLNLLAVKSVGVGAFGGCEQLRDIIFSSNLESIKGVAFHRCSSLQRLTIPLKTDLIDIGAEHFDACYRCTSLSHIDLVEKEVLSKTVATLLKEEWKDDMNREIDSIKNILPNTLAGPLPGEDFQHFAGEKGRVVQEWMENVLRKVIYYKAEHNRSLKVAATALQPSLPNDIVMKNVIPFLDLPSHMFEWEDEVVEESNGTDNGDDSNSKDDNGERKRRRLGTKI